MNTKLTVINYIALLVAVFFTVLQIHFKSDISAMAFILSMIFTVTLIYVSLILVKQKLSIPGLRAMAKMYEYAPFVYLIVFVLRRSGQDGTSYSYDVITVVLWLLILLFVFYIRYQINDKRVFDLNPLLAQENENLITHKLPVALRIIKEIVGWIDALVWAVFAVALINVFVFQLYEIPSESMVPEFLIKDRVAVLKILDGPKFPLSDVGIPRIRSYDRGDIVVFNNPHYNQDRQSEVKKFTSQLVYMFTLMQVNLNVDEDGNLKADPLVKRVCGVPGDQLVMVDGILYKRTEDSDKYIIVKDDAKWAEWNLAGLPQKTQEKIRDVRYSSDQYNEMLNIEKNRRSLDVQASAEECESLAITFSKLKESLSGIANKDLITGNISDFNSSSSAVPDLFSGSDLYIYDFFNNFELNTQKMLSVENGDTWFATYMTNWITDVNLSSTDSLIGGDSYSDAMFRMNLMAKLTFGRLVVTYSQAIANKTSVSEFASNDSVRSEIEQAQQLVWYMSAINDLRNMPVFPKNSEDGKAQYIPDHSYFMMGDNRFNSLDMRHSYTYKMTNITDVDKYSLRYNSNMAPQYVPDSNILGTTVLRIFPFSRFGIPGLTAEKSN